MNFGRYILVTFVLFACFMAVLVSVCVREEVGLVSKNYYEEELVHQEKMNQAKNSASLAHQPTISIDRNILTINFHEVGKVEKGQLLLLRPSDPSQDEKFEIMEGREQQNFKLKNPAKGLYRASLKWRMNNKEYYLEKLITI